MDGENGAKSQPGCPGGRDSACQIVIISIN